MRLLLTAREVAEHLSVSYGTVKKLAPKELPYFTIGNRKDRRYNIDDVEAYIKKHYVGK